MLRSEGAIVVAAFAFGVGIVFASHDASGGGLGFFFASFLLAGIAVPFLTRPLPRSFARRLLLKGARDCFGAPGALWTAIVVGWWVAPASRALLTFDLARAAVVLAAYLAALAALTFLLAARRMPSLASGFVAMLSLVWLTWPVWLSSLLSGPHGPVLVLWLAPVDPLMALNSALKPLGVWDHTYPIAYNFLTSLNQDTPYRLPSSILPSVLLDSAIAVAAMALTTAGGSRRALTSAGTDRAGI